MQRERTETEPRPRKTALLFAGQGVSGKDITEYYQILSAKNPDETEKYLAETQQVIDEIYEQDSFDIRKPLQNPYSPAYGSTAVVQPIVYTLSYLSYRLASENFQAENIGPSMVAGHSLGEYAALTAAGVIPFRAGLEIVTFRGKVMQETCRDNESILLNIVGLKDTEVEEIASQTGSQVSLYNAPSLIVIGAASHKASEIEQLANRKGAVRVSKLPTAGAFHSQFMQPAADKFEPFIRPYNFEDPMLPVVANITGDSITSGALLKNNVVRGLVVPVRWSKSIKTMRDSGVEIFVECGPGNILTSLNRFNNVDVPTLSATTLI